MASHGLSDQKRENRCMTIDNLKEQVDIMLRTTQKSFGLGELRILCILFLLLLAPTGARSTSALLRRFGDIRVILARDLDGGPHKTLTKFTLEFTKTYLGIQTFLLGILFRHRTFEAPSLTCPERLTQLDIHPGEQELPIPLKATAECFSASVLQHRPFHQQTAPIDLTADQAASINIHPTIKQLARRIEELCPRRKHSRKAMDEYTDAVRKLRNEKQRLKRALKQQIRDEWTDKQAVVDIEAQLNGLGLVKDSTVEASNCLMRPAQKRLVDALAAPVETTIEGQYRRRDAAINAIVAYCTVVEGPAARRTKSSTLNVVQQPIIKDDPYKQSFACGCHVRLYKEKRRQAKKMFPLRGGSALSRAR
ncbi:hypothetical protein DL765_005588 [Monosporascus sp. GIB2]|nr:hypothetical protein DL765_005588 [Monosporascus sp. GIB2]